MRLCRYVLQGRVEIGVYLDSGVVPLTMAAAAYARERPQVGVMSAVDDLLHYLPPDGPSFATAKAIGDWLASAEASGTLPQGLVIPLDRVQLKTPIPRPNKLLLLAGNYAEHIREGGGVAAERAETFPYVFMKPPSTTLTDPGAAVRIPSVSPDAIDWELELAVIIGRRCRRIAEADALSVVAGYTVVNDISNRRFRPNPGRKKREKDSFFDWLHGKWFDSFCPAGPCVLSADALADPQTLAMELRLNGEVRQSFSTAQMVFPVAAVIEFVSHIVTLEPGDIISTGTGPGVGSTTGTFVKPGDRLEARIERIGTLVSPVAADSD